MSLSIQTANPDFASAFTASIQSCAGNNPSLFDVELISSDGNSVSAHKLILAARSEFFANLFCGNGDGGGNGIRKEMNGIYMNGMSYPLLKLLVEFIYTGEAVSDETDVGVFMKAAKGLKILGHNEQVIIRQEDIMEEEEEEVNDVEEQEQREQDHDDEEEEEEQPQQVENEDENGHEQQQQQEDDDEEDDGGQEKVAGWTDESEKRFTTNWSEDDKRPKSGQKRPNSNVLLPLQKDKNEAKRIKKEKFDSEYQEQEQNYNNNNNNQQQPRTRKRSSEAKPSCLKSKLYPGQFECSLCPDKKYKSEKSCKDHIRRVSHRNVYQFKCMGCSQTFDNVERVNYMKHLREKHGLVRA